MPLGPSLAEHKALLAHDLAHGGSSPRLGARFHWARSWLWQKTRQWERCDALVCGANPILGALAASALAASGKKVIWAWSDAQDEWDYPLAVAGRSDDLFQQAGLPPMGEALFRELSRRGAGRITIARGWDVAYASQPLKDGPQLAFLDPAPFRRWGPAREQASRWAGEAFAGANLLRAKARPGRHGGGPRQLIVAHARLIRVSDALDGVARLERDEGAQAGDRLGRARWHAQTPWDFMERSREDARLAMEVGK